MLGTSYYAEQSSTAGRSAFITGQMPFRTGMSKVGMPGVIEIAKEFIETVRGRQEFIAIAKVVFTKLPGGVTQLFEESRKTRITRKIPTSANSLARAA
jgi:hypothetical protein